MDNFGLFWSVIKCCVLLLYVVKCCGTLFIVLLCYGGLWRVVQFCGVLCCGMMLNVVETSEFL